MGIEVTHNNRTHSTVISIQKSYTNTSDVAILELVTENGRYLLKWMEIESLWFHFHFRLILDSGSGNLFVTVGRFGL